ncbi:MAG TPA: hypothetical protein VNT00_08300 [Eoetvoesiella sp.]|uniref:hypothetical protein n=1 Tax=Eoetvoesiella sp. TaxID=1966355 RepID=UPI002BD12A1C|nr:hypothetical protein [Eoetvoesiella sp.]HWK61406.1 hypothetical protein [Eoetvoesiella sp.]
MKTLKELSTGRENSITFLRLMAAFAVIYGHAYAIVPTGSHDIVMQIIGYAHAGDVAVDFFLLSGFPQGVSDFVEIQRLTPEF